MNVYHQAVNEAKAKGAKMVEENTSDGFYKGYMANGKKEGPGKMIYTNKVEFIGIFKNDEW